MTVAPPWRRLATCACRTSQTVRDQIRDEVKAEVMTQAKEENWAQPNTFPDWVSRITVEGDVRVRDESRLYSAATATKSPISRA